MNAAIITLIFHACAFPAVKKEESESPFLPDDQPASG